MKKTIVILAAASLLWSSFLTGAKAESAAKPGNVIKGKGLSTVYYVGEDNKRYVFPNDKIYFSWYDDFSQVQEISLENLQNIPLGGNVHYKPGALLVKIQTDPKVYAVGANGVLRWVKTEVLAKEMYGSDWNKLVDDVPDSFFTNYTVGQAIEDEDDFDPSDESASYATFSHSKGWKERVREKTASKYALKKCENMERAVNTLQKRLERWGIEMPGLGEDFINTCVDQIKESRGSDRKVLICHKTATGSHEIYVSKMAVRAHLDHGDIIGQCGNSDTGTTTDETAPVISNLAASVTSAKTTITWNTDEDSDSKVMYALEPIASSTSVQTSHNASMVKSHSMEITGLATGTVYYYKVESKDAAGNIRVSEQKTFTTPVSDPDASSPEISDISADASTTSAVITWTTDEPSTSKLTYDSVSLTVSSDLKNIENTDMVTSHSLTVNGLTSSTTYYFIVESADDSDNVATSTQQTFLTL